MSRDTSAIFAGQLSVRAAVLGVALVVILSAANAYLGLFSAG